MTLSELKALPPEEINRLVAERVMGWTERDPLDWLDKNHWIQHTRDDWNPYSDHNDVATVRAEINRRGLTWKFSGILTRIVLPTADAPQHPYNWWLIDASCADQCFATLLSIEEPT